MKAKKKDWHQTRLDCGRKFVAALENGEHQQAEEILEEMICLRETTLFQEVGKLTRQLHEAIAGFTVDAKIAELTENELPDAKERLNYVITTTQKSADTTLNVVEALIPLSEQMGLATTSLGDKWTRFLRKEMEYDEFNDVSQELVDYFLSMSGYLDTLQSQLNEILMAQSFQDITGQIIKRVISMVQDVEHSMVELVRISGCRFSQQQNQKAAQATTLEGPAVPGLADQNTITDQDGVDDLLSSLGF